MACSRLLITGEIVNPDDKDLNFNRVMQTVSNLFDFTD